MEPIKLRDIEELDDLEKLALIPISYSRLSTYLSCPAKFFFSYIEKVDRVFSGPAALGNIVHSVLERAYKQDEEPLSQTDIILLFDDNVDAYDPEHQISQEDLNLGMEMMFEYMDRQPVVDLTSKQGVAIHTEYAFNVVIGSALLNGFIDKIIVDDDIVKVIDYKTGKYQVAQKNAPSDLQLGVYALIASHYFPNRKIRADLSYLRSGKKIGHWFTEEDLNEVKERLITGIWTLINDQNFVETSNRSACYMCDHSKSGKCKLGVSRISGRKSNQ